MRVYQLQTPTMGVLVEGNQRRVMVIPANAVVKLVEGDADGNGLVKIRYGEHYLEVFVVDLRNRGEALSEQSA